MKNLLQIVNDAPVEHPAITVGICLGILLIVPLIVTWRFLKIDLRRGWSFRKANVIGGFLAAIGAVVGSGALSRHRQGPIYIVNTGLGPNILVFAILFWLFGSSVGGLRDRTDKHGLPGRYRLRELLFLVVWLSALFGVINYISRHASH